jgi:GTPase involved in cell partitioning and DNA repair
MVEIPTPKPYIFMIRVTRQIKYLIAQVPGVISQAFNLPVTLDHKYIWLRGRDLNH